MSVAFAPGTGPSFAGQVMYDPPVPKLEHQSNNFDFLRFLAALLVIYGHSGPLAGASYQLLWGIPVSVIGLTVFFSLSGYLVAESWQRDPRIMPFFMKRSLRIFPGLIVCIVWSACLLGPALTRLSLHEYFAHPNFLEYFKNAVLLTRFALPGVFGANFIQQAVNVSLWSLAVEFTCYIAVALIGFGQKRISFVIVAGTGAIVCALSMYFTLLYKGPQIVIWGTDVAQAFGVIPYFFIGVLLAVLKDRLTARLDVALLAVFALFAVQGVGLNIALMGACWLAIPYIAIAFGSYCTPIVRRWGRFGDLSYGMYLYAFPIQQAIVQVSKNAVTPDMLAVLSALITIPIAFASWHLIERRALVFKPKLSATALRPCTVNLAFQISKGRPEA